MSQSSPPAHLQPLSYTLVFALSLIAPAQFLQIVAGDWTQFRGPTGQGHAADETLPLKWSRTENVAWNREIPGKAWSSPVITSGRVFLTTAVPTTDDSDGPQALRVLALEEMSGETVWNVKVFDQEKQRVHKKNSHASPTPVIDAGKIYVHFGTNGTACLDLNGNIVWKTQILVYNPVHGSGSSPVLTSDAVIVSCDGGDVQFIAALNRSDGELRWKTPRPKNRGKGFAFCTPLLIEVNNEPQVVSPASDYVCGYDPKDGREIWRVGYERNGYSVVPRPVYAHGLVFMSTGYDRPQLMAIDPSGTGDVTETHVKWRRDATVPRNAAPLVVGDELFIISDNGISTCLDARTGDEHWRERIGGNHTSAPLHGAERIYFLSEDGEASVIRAGTTFELLATNSVDEYTLASLAVSDGALFLRTESTLFRIKDTEEDS